MRCTTAALHAGLTIRPAVYTLDRDASFHTEVLFTGTSWHADYSPRAPEQTDRQTERLTDCTENTISWLQALAADLQVAFACALGSHEKHAKLDRQPARQTDRHKTTQTQLQICRAYKQ